MEFFKRLLPWVLVAVLLGNAISTGVPPTVVQTTEKAQTQSVKKQRVTIRPDGTKVVETETVKNISKEKTKRVDKPTVASAAKTSYRLGVDYLPSMREPRLSDIEVRAGYRLGQSPFWLETGVDIKHRQVTIGISVEW